MKYGYARVSTNGQARDGNSLESQQTALRSAGAEVIYADKFTGTKRHRPKLDELMSVLKSGDTLIVTKLDRIARSTIQGTELVSELLDKGVAVNVLNMGVMDNTSTGKLIRSIFFAFAEFERDMIVERTQEGKAIAKEKEGYREGRPTKEVPDLKKFIELQKEGSLTIAQCCKRLSISRSSWYNKVREHTVGIV